MNENIIDRKDSIEMIPQKKPIHLRIVSIGTFLLLTLVLLLMMDMVIVALAENLAISHAGIGGLATDDSIQTYVLAVRAIAIICLTISIALGLFWKKIYLHQPGRILQKLLMVTICFMIFVMFGLGFGLIVTFVLFFWNPNQLADWAERSMSHYRFGIIAILGFFISGEMFRVGSVTLMVIGLGSIILTIFVFYFWNPEYEGKISIFDYNIIYQVISLTLIALYFLSGSYLLGGALNEYPMTPFLILPLSSILTALGAGLVSLAPALLFVIPL